MHLLVTPDGERTMRVFLGASSQMGAEDLTLEGLDNVEIFHLEGYALYNQPLALKFLKEAKAKGKKVSYDLGSFELVKCFMDLILNTVLPHVDLVFCNEEESRQFADTPDEAIEILGSKCHVAVVMMGAKGCMIKCGEKKFIVAVEPLKSHEVIDSTGAGDLFCGGFLYAYMQGYPLEVCGYFGCLSGKSVCTVNGAEISLENWKIIKETGLKEYDRINKSI
jgi:sugar/nucleoside kinase (ribokinase family)